MSDDYSLGDCRIMEEYFLKITLPLNFLKQAYEELHTSNFYTSPHGLVRSDASKELKEQIQKEIPFEIFDCGFFKNSPGWSYQLHADTQRTCAINILMCNNSQDFVANFVSDNFKETINIPYVKDVPILFNTKKFHRVKNLSTIDNRFVLSIGHETYPYEITKNMFTVWEIAG